jgi:hypothetical protein
VKRADNIVVPSEALPDWMVELAQQVKLIGPDALLPTGVIVGSAVIEKVTPMEAPIHSSSFGLEPWYRWHLTEVERATTPRKPTGHPQPVWFKPF